MLSFRAKNIFFERKIKAKTFFEEILAGTKKNWDNLSQFRGNGILALDRGNDDENTIGFLQSNGYFAVVRQRHERDIFGNAKTIAQNLREGVPAKTKDNFSQINSKTFSFLQNLRALFCEKSLKFISGRPKNPPKIAPKQLIFPFYPA